MNQTNHNTNHDIFAEQYVVEYDKLCKSYPFLSLRERMRMAKEITNEYLYLKLREELPIEIKVWPEGFKA